MFMCIDAINLPFYKKNIMRAKKTDLHFLAFISSFSHIFIEIMYAMDFFKTIIEI